MRTGLNLKIRELKKEICDLEDKENRMWFQRSKVLWAANGDKNSKFFHCRATQRMRKNSILNIRNEDGGWSSDSEAVAETLTAYFQALFTLANLPLCEAATDSINRVITDEMNDQLSLEFQNWEVQQAIKQMAPFKAQGPDSMPPLFYQHYWDLIGEDVSQSVLTFLNSASLPEHLNHTFITLIPKKKNLEHASEFRPISLCNVLYKIFSKVLANRLKRILPKIITEHQSAFTKSRLIFDNILVAFESLHSMQKHNGKEGFMAIKLDMSKAYDRVEWPYLEAVMRKMGFNNKWIKLLMLCVTTISYSILVNGEPKGLIHPSRGIRQGDPISPFLFLLCTEGLHGLISKAASQGDIRGYSLCRNSPRSTSEDIREHIKLALGVPEIKQYEKYLGLPSLVGRNKKASFNYIKERWGQKGDRRKIHWVKWGTLCFPKSDGGMGFKDLALFNDALLAKQAWRLLHHKNSLFYRVFKSKCFGIVQLWKLLIQPQPHMPGILPPLDHPRILSPQVKGFEDLKVFDLIDPEFKSWDENLLHGLFIPEEVSLIKSIPLCITSVEDKLVWPFTASGEYTVKFGYNFLAKLNLNTQASGQLVQDNGIWKLVWGLRIPNKVKNFIWRSCRDTIPVKNNLKKRQILQDDSCDHYHQVSKMVLHAIWECPTLTPIWDSIQELSFRKNRSFRDTQELLLFANEEEKFLEMMVVTMWTIWSCRNQIRVQQNVYPIDQVVPNARQVPSVFHRANRVQQVPTTVSSTNRVTWIPPPANSLKINFDGALFRDINKVGLGVVIRNDHGQVLASLSEQIQLPFSSDLVEAMAAARAISFAHELSLSNYILEGDSEVVIKALKSNDDSLSSFGHILASAKTLTDVNCITFSHT
ncbi:uncharacterized protein LOC126719473 [Quercus robur]|uniref:uncharacterized protein LOC126719473 n=1 Tax=Quercus robur TaxID=38942 RepID=UPI002162A880|nr:uncharacterized protein LOC126719473 [Quercus robur]